MSSTRPESDPSRRPRGAEPQAPCLVGLIGRGIQRSKSPTLHESEATAQGLHLIYELMDLDERGGELLSDLLNEAERRGFAGLNITYPCKQAVIPLLHELSEEAQAVGAVNTVHFSAGRRIGYNTDAWGFEESFRRGLGGASLTRVVQVGAGGAGAATAFALLRLGVQHLSIVDTDFDRARTLAASLARHFKNPGVSAVRDLDLAQALASAAGVVNSTPVGMEKHPGSAVPAGLLHVDLWVADIVYFPIETQLLRAARAVGCRTLDGGGMVVYQAARAFEIFTGRAADSARMRQSFEVTTAT
jgi:quinate/shikimate dehydrogenase (NAD+)